MILELLSALLSKLSNLEKLGMTAVQDIATLTEKIETLGGKVDNLVHLFDDQKTAIEDLKTQLAGATPAIDVTPLFGKLDAITSEIDGTLNPPTTAPVTPTPEVTPTPAPAAQ